MQSKGIKRALGILFLLASNAVNSDPKLAAYSPILMWIGGVLGVVGVAHATLSK